MTCQTCQTMCPEERDAFEYFIGERRKRH